MSRLRKKAPELNIALLIGDSFSNKPSLTLCI